jgi:AcrR family transcriptional regulator
VHQRRGRDRRIAKTEALLREALASLLREKPYDDIVVKDIVERANVGRSTFYMHYRDKDELLQSGIHDLLRAARPARGGRGLAKVEEGIVWFGLPILEHIEGHRRTEGATVGHRGRRTMHQSLQQAVARLVEDEVRAALRRSHRAPGSIPPGLVARWVASTFVLVLNWWVESDSALSAGDADRVFRGLIEPSVAQILA